MPKRNVYLPPNLDDYATREGINLSRLVREGLRAMMAADRGRPWEPEQELEPYRELSDAEERAEELTWD